MDTLLTDTLFTFTTPPHPCSYLPDREAQMRYDLVRDLRPAQYVEMMDRGWRRFGHTLFRPVCSSCRECRPIRLPAAQFHPSRSQRRVARLNTAEVQLTIAAPSASEDNLALYQKYHAFQQDFKGWPGHRDESAADYQQTFVDNPIPTEEWQYRVDSRLIGVGYVDPLPTGLSAIYFFYDPEERWRSPGTWNVLSVIAQAQQRGLPYVYLGYYVRGCRSLEYKAHFEPNEVLDPSRGQWVAFTGSVHNLTECTTPFGN